MIKQRAMLFLLLLMGCTAGQVKKQVAIAKPVGDTVEKFYAAAIKDTFSVFVSLPADYTNDAARQYPVIYLLDANLYFDIFSTILKKYGEVGLLPPAILVGIGYKDFPTMDSLRNRDYTYPLAISAYEMPVSGGADKFYRFVSNELVPAIDRQYRTNHHQRVLMGHSLGGYFTLFALQQQMLSKAQLFAGFVAASPSMHYNHYYLLHQLSALPADSGYRPKVFAAFGGMEDAAGEGGSTVAYKLPDLLASFRKMKYMDGKEEIYSNLDHMDTQLPTFVKGVQWVLEEKK